MAHAPLSSFPPKPRGHCSCYTYLGRVAPGMHRETTHQERGETGGIPNCRPPGCFTRGSTISTTVFKHTQVCSPFSKGEATGTPTHTLTPSHAHPATLHAGPRAGQSKPSNIFGGPPPPRTIPASQAGISKVRGRRAPPDIRFNTQDLPNLTITQSTRSQSKPPMHPIPGYWPNANSGQSKIPCTGIPSMGPRISGDPVPFP